MTNEPTTLFKDYQMRKSTKSTLKNILLKDVPSEFLPPSTHVNIKVEQSLTAHKNQQQFLSNNNNKSELISFLSSYLQERHEVYQSINNADTAIVFHALTCAKSGKTTTVVADDTDILVLLMYHYCKETMADIYIRSEATKRRKAGLQIYNIRTALEDNDTKLVRNLLFVHAWSGCDSTSGIFGHSKGSIVKLIKSSQQFKSTSQIYNSDHVHQSDLK